MVKALSRLAVFAALAGLLACGGGGGKSPDKGQTVPLQVTSTNLAQGTVSAAYQQSLTASGGVAPFTWTIAPSSGVLPSGLSLSTLGVISGTPTLAGTFPFTVNVSDPNGDSGTANLSITLVAAGTAPLTITTASLPDGKISTAYVQLVTASGGTPPYSWTLVGSLPTGMSLSTDGVISGTPTVTGQFTFALQVTDSLGQTKSGSFTLNITGV